MTTFTLPSDGPLAGQYPPVRDLIFDDDGETLSWWATLPIKEAFGIACQSEAKVQLRWMDHAMAADIPGSAEEDDAKMAADITPSAEEDDAKIKPHFANSASADDVNFEHRLINVYPRREASPIDPDMYEKDASDYRRTLDPYFTGTSSGMAGYAIVDFVQRTMPSAFWPPKVARCTNNQCVIPPNLLYYNMISEGYRGYKLPAPTQVAESTMFAVMGGSVLAVLTAWGNPKIRELFVEVEAYMGAPVKRSGWRACREKIVCEVNSLFIVRGVPDPSPYAGGDVDIFLAPHETTRQKEDILRVIPPEVIDRVMSFLPGKRVPHNEDEGSTYVTAGIPDLEHATRFARAIRDVCFGAAIEWCRGDDGIYGFWQNRGRDVHWDSAYGCKCEHGLSGEDFAEKHGVIYSCTSRCISMEFVRYHYEHQENDIPLWPRPLQVIMLPGRATIPGALHDFDLSVVKCAEQSGEVYVTPSCALALLTREFAVDPKSLQDRRTMARIMKYKSRGFLPRVFDALDYSGTQVNGAAKHPLTMATSESLDSAIFSHAPRRRIDYWQRNGDVLCINGRRREEDNSDFMTKDRLTAWQRQNKDSLIYVCHRDCPNVESPDGTTRLRNHYSLGLMSEDNEVIVRHMEDAFKDDQSGSFYSDMKSMVRNRSGQHFVMCAAGRAYMLAMDVIETCAMKKFMIDGNYMPMEDFGEVLTQENACRGWNTYGGFGITTKFDWTNFMGDFYGGPTMDAKLARVPRKLREALMRYHCKQAFDFYLHMARCQTSNPDPETYLPRFTFGESLECLLAGAASTVFLEPKRRQIGLNPERVSRECDVCGKWEFMVGEKYTVVTCRNCRRDTGKRKADN